MLDNQAQVNQFKAIYAPLQTPGARTLAAGAIRPVATTRLLDDFTERVDTDVSNNAGLLGVEGPPRSFGLYRDGNRIAALPQPPGPVARLCNVRAGRAALQAGAACARAAGGRVGRLPHCRSCWRSARRRCACWNPSRCCTALWSRGWVRRRPWRGDPRVTLSDAGPVAAARAWALQARCLPVP